jgi:hypothetical protein
MAAIATAHRLFVLWGEEAVFMRVRKFEDSDCQRHHVRPSAGNDLASTGRIFVKFCSNVLLKSV